jgi:hypothetical protein
MSNPAPCPHNRYPNEECPWCARDALEGWRHRDPQPWGRFDVRGGDTWEIEDIEEAERAQERDSAGY